MPNKQTDDLLRQLKRGRKPRCTPKLREDIAGHIAGGNPISTACALVGISEDSFYRWMRLGATGEKKHECYRLFRARMEQARQYAVARRVRIIQDAAESGVWQAAAWWLERMYPENFGRRLSVEHGGAVDTSGDYDKLKDLLKNDEFRALAERIIPVVGK